MKITIKNFRSMVERDFELPETGMVQLAGDSEKGKTTLVESMVWAFFGTEGTRNVTPLSGGRKTKVELTFRDLEIDRQKGPNSFICNGLSDEAGQGVVDSKIASVEHFKLSSYVQQKMRGCFLTLTPKNQLDFLEKLAIDVDVDAIKKRVKERADTHKRKIEDLDLCIKTTNISINDTREKLNSLGEPQKVEDPTEEIERVQEEVNSLSVEKRKRLDAIQKLVDEKNDPKRTAGSKIAEQEAIRSSLMSQLADVEKKISESKSEVEVASLLAEAQLMIRDIEKKEESNRLYTEDLGELKKHGLEYKKGSMTHLYSAKEMISNRMNSASDRISELDAIVKSSQTLQSCPHCSGSVRVVGGSVTAGENKVDTVPMLAEIASNKEDLMKLDAQSKACAYLIAFGEKWSDYEYINDLACNYVQAEDYAGELQRELGEIRSNEKRKSDLELEIDKCTSVILSLSHTSDCLRSIEALDGMIETENSAIRSIDTQIELKRTSMGRLSEQQLKWKAYQSVENQRETYSGILSNEWSKVADYKTEQEEAEKELKKVLRLSQIVTKAQLSAIESLIENINTSAQIYLDQFFPGCGTSIRILPYKQNQDNTKSDKVGVEIVHNGVEFKSLSEFSGGAENRAILAFQLAISDIVASPILLLDEPLVGVHSELRNEIYESIREVAKDRLVVVVEHGAPEHLFDQIVRL